MFSEKNAASVFDNLKETFSWVISVKSVFLTLQFLKEVLYKLAPINLELYKSESSNEDW